MYRDLIQCDCNCRLQRWTAGPWLHTHFNPRQKFQYNGIQDCLQRSSNFYDQQLKTANGNYGNALARVREVSRLVVVGADLKSCLASKDNSQQHYAQVKVSVPKAPQCSMLFNGSLFSQ